MGVQQRCVVLTVVLVLAVAAVRAVDICDICECAKNQGEVKTVLCNCNQDKVLNITEDKMSHVVHITDFGVSNCTSVNFHKSAFKKAHDLRSVTISRISTVTINVGVFSSLSSLLVEDVNDLRLERMALLGAAMEDITIYRSNISVLQDLVLYQIVGLRKVELAGVTIGLMKARAVNLEMVGNSEFVINGCEVGTIESNAVNVTTDKLFISKSLFEDVRPNAVKVSASKVVRVMKNVFRVDMSTSGLLLTADRISIEENTFSYLPIGLLKRPEGASSNVSFTNNIVYNFTLMSDGVDLSTMLNLDDFQNNEVLCDCELAKTVLAYKVFQAASAPRKIVEQNYCHLESSAPCKLSLQTLSDLQLQVCDGNTTVDLEVLCQSLPPSSTSQPRGGRAEGLPDTEPWQTTIPPSTSTEAVDVHRDASHHTASAGPLTGYSTPLAALAAVVAFARCLLV